MTMLARPVALYLTAAEAEEARHHAFERFLAAPKADRRSAHARYQVEIAEIDKLEDRS